MMPSVNIQFHMLFDELTDFVADVRSQYHLGVELERWFPKTVRQVPSDADLHKEIKEFGQVDRFWLLCKIPRSRTVDRFMLNVGEQKGKRLAQAHLGAGTKRATAFAVLKKIAAELKRRTKSGIWLVTDVGNIGYIKNERISEGATIAARTGKINLVGIAFTSSYYVDPPEMEGA